MANKKTEEAKESKKETEEIEETGKESEEESETATSSSTSKTSSTSSKSKKTGQVSEKEFEKKVVELAQNEETKTAEKIGENLRSQGIHPGEYKKKISQILKENELYENPDLVNLNKKLQKLSQHFENNKQDKRARRERDRVHAQLRKLRRYFNLPEKEKKKAKR